MPHVHQLWLRPLNDEKVPDVYQCYHEGKWQALDGYKLWRTDDCLNLLNDHYPHYRAIWDRMNSWIERADLMRYVIVYHYGGLYVDLDVGFIQDFRAPVVDYILYPEWLDRKDQPLPTCYSNMLFYCREPQSLLMLSVLMAIMDAYSDLETHFNTIEEQVVKRRLKIGEKLYYTTGPRMFTMVYEDLNVDPLQTRILGYHAVQRHSVAFWKHELQSVRNSYDI